MKYIALIFCLSLALFIPASSQSAHLALARDAGKVTLKVTKSAQVTWRSGTKRAVLCCAINARPTPDKSLVNTVKQVHFRISYGAKLFGGVCLTPRQTVALSAKVCRAKDGSHWALQKWERLWPNYGGNNAPEELEISHWTGEQAKFENVHWTRSQFTCQYPTGSQPCVVLHGKLTYRGEPVFGYFSDRLGKPLDSYGRLIYLDAYNSDYGPGWRRVNSFLAQIGTGEFHYIFARHNGGFGIGEKYRITANGPGVTPVIRLPVDAPPSIPPNPLLY